MKNLNFFNKIKSPIARKLLYIILISSTIITLFLIVIQLSIEYKTEVSNLENKLNQIKESQIKPLALSVWTYNKNQQDIQIDGMLNLEDVVYVEVLTTDNKKVISKGVFEDKNIIRKEFLLKTVSFGKEITAGKLVVIASLERIYEELYNKILFIFFTQGIKTLIISFIILYAFYRLVTKHLYTISEYTRSIDLDSNDNLKLNRLSNEDDELDHIVFALNDMQEKIRKGKDELRNLNANLELKVEKRTTELNELNKELTKLTNIDPLTGAFNRRYFNSISDELIALAKRENRSLCLAMIDIDDFKIINDTNGHDIGDDVLKTIVTKINESIRSSDLLIRFGGEEFVLLFPNTSTEQAIVILEKIREIIQECNLVNNIAFTVSIGISEFNSKELDIDKTVKRADEALYIAKGNGKNRIEKL